MTAFAAVVVAGFAALALVAAGDERDLAFTLGVQPTNVAAVLEPGDTVCQGPIDISETATSVELLTLARPRPDLRVSVRDATGRPTLSSGTVAPRGAASVAAPLRGLESGSRVSVCVENIGRARVGVMGGAPQAARTSAARLDRKELPADLTLVFRRNEGRSTLAALPDVFARAALFHASWLESWMLWGLAALVLIGGPLLLARALAVAGRD